MERQLAIFIRKHGPVAVLEEIAKILEALGEERALRAAKYKTARFKDEGFRNAARWRTRARMLQKTIAAMRGLAPVEKAVRRRHRQRKEWLK